MQRVVIKVEKGKCVLDLIAEMGENVLGKRLFFCKAINDELFADASDKIQFYNLCMMTFAETRDHCKTILITKERFCGEEAGWFETTKIDAEDIAFTLAPEYAEEGLFFEIS